MPTGERPRRRARGFTYLGVLLLVAVIGLLLGAGAQVVSTVARRERETQLLWVGHAYRTAIGHFWSRRGAYPERLEDLLGDTASSPLPVRYLRRLYPDPMTNAADWVLLKSPFGGIMGVASRSTRPPLKTGNFDEVDQDFAEATTYRDWQFTFQAGAPRRPTR